jgi:hypothetical protein
MSPLLAAVLLAPPLPVEPVTLLIQTPNAPKLPETTKDEAAGWLRETLEKTIRARLEENGYAPTFLPAENGLDRPIRREEAQRLASQGQSRVTVLRLERWDQKNISHADMIANPNRPKSETKVQLRMWFVADGAVDPDRKLEGSAGGAYFGTTDRSELGGSPQAKMASIRLTNQRRLDAIAAATWSAIRFQFPKRD